jgi:uncharacterized protein YegP (UPF0339 family)
MGKFLIKRTPTGYKFDLKAHNGEIVATSEVYTTKAACLKGIQSVMASAVTAPCADITTGEQAKNPKFELFRDKSGHYRFRLLARNGKIIAKSEGYMTHYGCEKGIASVRCSAADAEIEEAEQNPPK